MTVEMYLKQAFTIDKLIKAKEIRIKDLRDKMAYVSPVLSHDKVQSSTHHDSMSEYVSLITELEAECQRDIVRLISVQKEIEALINQLECVVMRLIMYYRYVVLIDWDDIPSHVNYSHRHTHRLHGKALHVLKEIFKDGTKCH